MNTRNLLHTTAIVSPLLVLLLVPKIGLAEISSGNGNAGLDNIVITQSAATKNSGTNTATVSLDGNITTIRPINDFAQAGDGNDANFDILGSSNTIYFAQSGNSVVTMQIDGDQNTVTLNDFGGNSARLAELKLNVVGEGNQLEIGANQLYAVADLLDIDVGADFAIVKIKYSDYAEIVADIIGDGGNITIEQTADLPNAENNNEVTLFVESVSQANSVYLLQYGDRNNILANVVGGNNNVYVYQYQYNNTDMKFSSHSLNLQVTGDDNKINTHSDASKYVADTQGVISVTGNRNDMHLGITDNSYVDIAGSDNVLNSHSKKLSLNLKGSNNYIRHEDNSFSSFEFGTHDASIYGDGNKFTLEFWGDAALSSKVFIEGSWNSVNLSFGEVIGLGNRSIQANIIGNSNFITSEGYLNLGADIQTGQYLEFDIAGDDNSISFDTIQYVGLNASIIGDKNVASFNDTDDLFAEITGASNSLKVIGSSNSITSNYLLTGNENSVSVSNIHSNFLDMTLGGNKNVVSVSGVNELSIDLNLNGNGNSYLQDMNDIYDGNDFAFEVNAKAYGDYNSITVASVPEYSYSKLNLNIVGDLNMLTMSGVGSSYLNDISIIDIDILGDLNNIDVLAGTTASLSVGGDNYAMNLNYDSNLGTYVNTISNVGQGNVTLTTADGSVSIDAS